jgi:hypothetical protein
VSPEAFAERLRGEHPELDPFELGPEEIERLLAGVGVDPAADELVAATLVAWERLIL